MRFISATELMKKMMKASGCKRIKGQPGLGVDDVHQAEGAGQHDDGDQGQPQGQLVADHLGRAPDGPQQAVLGVGGPAAQGHAVDRQGREGIDDRAGRR